MFSLSIWNREHWFWGNISHALPLIKKAFWVAVLLNFFQILVSLFVMAVYNKVIPNSAFNSLASLAIGVAFIMFFEFALRWVKARLADDAERLLDEKLEPQLFAKVLAWDLDKRPKFAGSTAALVKDLESLSEFFTNQTISTVVGIVFIVVYVVAIWFVAQYLAVVTALMALSVGVLSYYFYLKVSAISEDGKKLSIEKNSIFLEAVSNLETLKSIGSYDYFQRKWNHTESSSRELSSGLRLVVADMQSWQSLIQSMGQVLIISMGAILVIRGDISGGGMFAAIMLNSRVAQPLGQLSGVLQRFSMARSGFNRLNTLFTTHSQEEKRRQNLRMAVVSPPISVQSLTYKPEGLQYDIVSVPRLGIRQFDRVGIVGTVGSGKSTLLKLLSGVLTPTTGAITYSAYDTTAIHQSDLRASVAYLSQHPAIFAGSVRDNIVLGHEAQPQEQDERLREVIEMTGLEVVLKGLPNGLSFMLSEGGRELSGGQKQILALARAMYANPTTLLLDEPTSAMDPRHERLFINRMKTFVQNKTFMVVTHRKPILELTERIIVMEGGKIIMDGDRDEILQKFK